jgi:hypothetical protein
MRKRDEIGKQDSCLNRAHNDELIFVLLSRDEDAPRTIRYWIACRIESGKNKPGDPKLIEAEECARTMEIEQGESS